MKIYEKFKSLPIDFSEIGLIQRSGDAPYFCTPEGADIIGWAGVDGIHYCFVKNFGDTVFAVSPMNGAGTYVHPLAENFREFLRLLLACRDLAAMEQAWQWSEAVFLDFVNGISQTDEQERILKLLGETFGLTPMEAPWNYMKRLRDAFDYSAIPFREEYYDIVGEEAPMTQPEWKVTFDGTLFGHGVGERAGEEIFLDRHFQWEGESWYIPSVYACGKGLVVDFCIAVEPERMRDFMKKWNISNEVDCSRMSPERQREMEREHPMNIDFRAFFTLNGRNLQQKRGSAVTYLPPLLLESGTENPPESRWVVEHYGLDEWMGWAIHRISFPWATKRKPVIRTLTLKLDGRNVFLYGKPFPAPQVGENVQILHPLTGAKHTLCAETYEKQILDHSHMDDTMEFPTHYTTMTYRLTPDLPDRAFSVRDVRQNDSPRAKSHPVKCGGEDFASSAIAIIGGVDGSTAVLFSRSAAESEGALHAACSALLFEETERVMWQPVFCEKLRHETEIELI